ncbi:Uncharacterised protein [Vibrio cholerae]|nr:Uncharacterised protein [Vibrio cholerae]
MGVKPPRGQLCDAARHLSSCGVGRSVYSAGLYARVATTTICGGCVLATRLGYSPHRTGCRQH